MQAFVDGILQRMIFDGEQLSDLMAPLDLGWKARSQAELALMADLVPLLTKRAQGRDNPVTAFQESACEVIGEQMACNLLHLNHR